MLLIHCFVVIIKSDIDLNHPKIKVSNISMSSTPEQSGCETR